MANDKGCSFLYSEQDNEQRMDFAIKAKTVTSVVSKLPTQQSLKLQVQASASQLAGLAGFQLNVTSAAISVTRVFRDTTGKIVLKTLPRENARTMRGVVWKYITRYSHSPWYNQRHRR